MTVTRENKVGEFLKAAGEVPYEGGKFNYSYLNNLKEEANELLDALSDYVNNPTSEARGNLCKEWADVQVVLSNIAWYMGIPADAAFNRVHANNMTKVVDGKIRRREDGKILKPEGFVKADMRGL
jgi:predicted HAD superfamily Cof-like phosphohydrolase